ncbi:MAG: DUF6782 family putative metallopeptidase [Alphaproteobacteria bacterium]
MAESDQTSTETARLPAGSLVDKTTGKVLGQILLDKPDKGRAGRLARAEAVARVARRWQRGDFRAFQRGLSQARRDKDKAALEKAFNLAAEVPVFKEALDWAKENGIEFFVDRTCSKYVGAYYTGTTGVIGVNHRALQNPQLMAIYLTHEIRHAWQDAHGIMGHSMKPDYAGEAIRTALVEADAMAFETLAAHQAARAVLQKRQAEKGLPPDLATRLKRMEKMCANAERDLWRGFETWFQTSRPFFYCEAVAKREATVLGIRGEAPKDHKYEFKAMMMPGEKTRLIDVTDEADFQKLGTTFSGGNYLNEKKRREFVKHTVNNPSLARTFWRAGAKTPKLLTALRKKELQMKQDTPQLHIDATGQPSDIQALANLLEIKLKALTEVEKVEADKRSSLMLNMTVTFKKGIDPVTAFRNAAIALDGQWAHVAPSVMKLYIEGMSKTMWGARGRLERNPYRPPNRTPGRVMPAATP